MKKGDISAVELHLTRDLPGPVATLGTLTIDGDHECFILEPTEKRIPAGRYRVKITYSKTFGRRLPEVLNVPKRYGIRIHEGNKAEDSRGCLLTGTARSENRVINSKIALAALQTKLIAAGEEEVWLTITEKEAA